MLRRDSDHAASYQCAKNRRSRWARALRKTALLFLAGGALVSGRPTFADEGMFGATPKMPAFKPSSNKSEQQLALARLCERRSESAKAREIYANLVKSAPKEIKASAHHRLAVMAAKDERFDQADEHFRQALANLPNDSMLLSDAGYYFYLREQYGEAEKLLRRAVDRDAKNQAARNNLGLVLGRQGRFQESYAVFRDAGPEAQATNNLAFVYAQKGDVQKAEQLYSRAVSLNPKLKPAAESLVQIAQHKDRNTRANQGSGRNVDQVAGLPVKQKSSPLVQSPRDNDDLSGAPTRRPNSPQAVARRNDREPQVEQSRDGGYGPAVHVGDHGEPLSQTSTARQAGAEASTAANDRQAQALAPRNSDEHASANATGEHLVAEANRPAAKSARSDNPAAPFTMAEIVGPEGRPIGRLVPVDPANAPSAVDHAATNSSPMTTESNRAVAQSAHRRPIGPAKSFEEEVTRAWNATDERSAEGAGRAADGSAQSTSNTIREAVADRGQTKSNEPKRRESAVDAARDAQPGPRLRSEQISRSDSRARIEPAPSKSVATPPNSVTSSKVLSKPAPSKQTSSRSAVGDDKLLAVGERAVTSSKRSVVVAKESSAPATSVSSKKDDQATKAATDNEAVTRIPIVFGPKREPEETTKPAASKASTSLTVKSESRASTGEAQSDASAAKTAGSKIQSPRGVVSHASATAVAKRPVTTAVQEAAASRPQAADKNANKATAKQPTSDAAVKQAAKFSDVVTASDDVRSSAASTTDSGSAKSKADGANNASAKNGGGNVKPPTMNSKQRTTWATTDRSARQSTRSSEQSVRGWAHRVFGGDNDAKE